MSLRCLYVWFLPVMLVPLAQIPPALAETDQLRVAGQHARGYVSLMVMDDREAIRRQAPPGGLR